MIWLVCTQTPSRCTQNQRTQNREGSWGSIAGASGQFSSELIACFKWINVISTNICSNFHACLVCKRGRSVAIAMLFRQSTPGVSRQFAQWLLISSWEMGSSLWICYDMWYLSGLETFSGRSISFAILILYRHSWSFWATRSIITAFKWRNVISTMDFLGYLMLVWFWNDFRVISLYNTVWSCRSNWSFQTIRSMITYFKQRNMIRTVHSFQYLMLVWFWIDLRVVCLYSY